MKMRFTLALLAVSMITLAMVGCGDSAKFDQTQQDADYIIAHLHQPEVLTHFPARNFSGQSRTGIEALVKGLETNCDWPSRDGKYVDFFSMSNNGQRSVAYIYEYFLKCDSLRFVLVYDLESKEPTLANFRVEPLEKPSELIVDPSKQLIPSRRMQQIEVVWSGQTFFEPAPNSVRKVSSFVRPPQFSVALH